MTGYLKLNAIVSRTEDTRAGTDGRRLIIRVVADYRDASGNVYRKTFESYTEPVVPQGGFNAALDMYDVRQAMGSGMDAGPGRCGMKVTIDQLLHWQKQIEDEQHAAVQKRVPGLDPTIYGAHRAGVSSGIREIVAVLRLHDCLEVK